jgi:two-component system, OmpR family, alkaline phosphatase synthesis response regulator PhoP
MKTANESAKILVVDDDPDARGFLSVYLKKKKYLIEEAEDGEEALEKIDIFNPDVILLDIMMPKLTGDQLVKMITLRKPNIKVIMITALSDQEIKAECIKNGAFAYLNKPVSLKNLFSTINKSLDSKK